MKFFLAVSLSLVAMPVHALSDLDLSAPEHVGNGCHVRVVINENGGNSNFGELPNFDGVVGAGVLLGGSNGEVQAAGGSYYGMVNPFSPQDTPVETAASITSEALSQCFGDLPVSNLAQTGAGAANFAAADYVGFSFDVGGYHYEYALQGAQNTVWVETQTALANQAPTADAGSDQAVASAAPVTLNGSASSDPDASQTLTYAWTAPAGIALSDATAAIPTFTAPTLAAGDADATLTFSLIVTDNLGLASVADEVTITVTAPSDTVAPDAPTLVVSGNPDGTVTASGTAEPGSVVKVTFPDGSTVMTTTVEDGSYTVTSAAAQPSGDVTATATDDAGNVSPEAAKPYVAADTITETQEQIAGFMLGRANNLASNQPGLARFLMGEGCGNFNASATEGSGSVSGCATRGNTWAEINSSWSGDGSYTLGTLGAHASLNPNLLVGGMVQFDYADDPANNASGKGWMVGPYFVAKTPNQPLYFEGRLLYGQTDNEITPLGTYTDSFETERLLAQLRASGQYELKNTTLMPLLDFTYTEDRQKAYTDSLGNTIPDQTVDLMQVSAGLDFSTPLSVQMGSLELTGGIKGIYSSSNGATAAPEFENWRGRTHIGLNYDTGRGTTVRFGSFYDGLGTNYESYGANLNFDVRF